MKPKKQRPAKRKVRKAQAAVAGKNEATSSPLVRALLRPRIELEAVLERYAELFDLAPIAYTSFDRFGRVEEANLAASRLVGRSRDTFVGSPFTIVVHSQDVPLFLEHLKQCREAKNTIETELRLRHRDGKILHALLSSSASPTVRGGAQLYQTVIVDLTERKRAGHQQAAIHQFVQSWHEADSLDDIYEAALDAVTAAVNCDRATILLFDHQGRMRYIAGRGVSKVYCKAVDGHSPWNPSTKNPRPIWLGEIARSDLPARLKHLMRREGIVTCGYIPLLNQERLIGKFTLCWDRPHQLSEQDETAALTLAGQLALAIERFRAVEQLRQSEERFRQFAESSADVFWIVDAQARKLEYLSPVFEKMFGDPRGRILRDINRWTELILPEDRKIGTDMLSRIVAGETVTVDYRILRPNDKKIRWIRDTGFPIRDEDGKVRRAAGLLQDITEEKARLEALRASEERFRYLVEGARDYAIFMLDPTNTIVHWNIGAERVFGWPAEEAVGQSGRLVFTPEDRKKKQEEKEIAVAMRDGVAPDKRWHLRKDGSRIWVEGVMHRVNDEKTGALRGFAKIARDATAQHEAQEELERRVQERTAELTAANQRLHKEIEQRTRLEQEILLISEREKRRIGQDLHDTLCQELAAAAFLLQSKAQALGKSKPQAAALLSESAQLVNANISLARDLARGLHPVEVSSVGLSEALRDLAFRRSDGHVICRFECPRQVRIRDEAVALNLYRIAQEAVTNALKNGKATEVVIRLERTRRNLLLSVQDNGTGFRSDKTGRGMGLDIMKYRAHIIEAQLGIESCPGEGTTVTCTLPGE